jgi:hypothetical protein
MPKVKSIGPAVRRGVDAVRRRVSPWHWFDHPEMQARIASAEDDLANGRYTDTPASEYLERLRNPA